MQLPIGRYCLVKSSASVSIAIVISTVSTLTDSSAFQPARLGKVAVLTRFVNTNLTG